MVIDILFIITISITSALLSEGLSWLLVYRTESYQRMKASADKLQAQVDKIKETESTTSTIQLKNKAKDKKLERIEESLKLTNKDLSFSKMKSMFAVAVSMIALFTYLNTVFDGKIVCKLPFEPIGFIQNLSHRNIPGKDYTDCSMTFLYVLCSMFIRTNIQTIMGTKQAASKQSNPFAMQQ
ncbi:hypothetical protein PPL_10291 [Heterostelium album PN500]|uniref:Calcium load-activated calcium channel n=1 Tax=Heterostelium pallidum (strain ATCC 26659 / Pp 5 / PN500) TaxID=670386 RepID=D3BQV3_HETP5|nr:hypothetical protein PPL_10291 [Heterostelium album PN500]EFA76523.1 hypothetical protein PPL_10291 [Heterostelium album PN500]|eukprot:XP_020428655.1 hypothetical protein PPL_10291 [Heterostelium album PN500]